MGKGIVKLGEGNWAVKDGNLLAAKETNGRFKNAEFTVARGTRATYVGRDGLIKESNLQDVNLVNNGDFEELGSELVTNGTFDTDSDWAKGTGWSIEDGKARRGGHSVNSDIRQSFPVVNGGTYKFSYTRAYESGNGKTNLYIQLDNANYSTLGTYDSTVVEEHTVEGYFTTTFTGDLSYRLYGINDFTGTIDNVSVKQVDPNDYWTLSSTFEIENGKLHCVSDGSYQYAYQGNAFVVGKTYKITFDILDYTSGSIRVRPSGQSGYTAFNANGTYTQYFTATNTTLAIERDSACNLYIDNVSVKEVKTDTPRIDFTDNTDGHLLLEPQSTNLITYSEDFSGYTIASSIATPNSTTAPDGANTGTLVTAGTNAIALRPSNIVETGKTYTFSCYVKSSGSNITTVSLDIADEAPQAVFTLTNDWQRITTTATVTKTPQSTYHFVDVSTNGSQGDTFYIWGAQVEELSYATSYIPTNGSTVTRDGETCTGAGEAIDFNSEEGVLYIETAALANDGTFRIMSISDGTLNNEVALYYRNSDDRITARLRSGSGTQVIFESFNLTATNFSKVAFRYKSGESNVFIDGVKQKASDYTTTSMPVGLSSLQFTEGWGNLPFYGKCKAIRVYKEALSDSELITLTS